MKSTMVPFYEKSKCIEEAERTKSANLMEIRVVIKSKTNLGGVHPTGERQTDFQTGISFTF
jgi:hypothetical protein